MSWIEVLLIGAGLSMNIFLVSEYEGSMLKQVNMKKLFGVCGIFFLWQIVSILLGHLITLIPFFQKSSSEDLKKMCCVIAAIIFLMISAYMLYKAWKQEIILERLSEIQYKRVFLEAALVGFFTFLCGIGCGFLGNEIWKACGILACGTVLAVFAGIWLGYHQGCIFRRGFYGISGFLFLAVGVDIVVRYL